MARQEAGKWKPYNVKAIIADVARVFKSRAIDKLNGPTYNFITLHMGFIAHYSLYGFRYSYGDLEKFARTLQTSEYSNDHEYNLRQADRQERDAQFNTWYGPAYNKSIAEAIRGIVAIARKYYPGTRGTRPLLDHDLDYSAHAEPVTAVPSKKKAKKQKSISHPVQSIGVRGVR